MGVVRLLLCVLSVFVALVSERFAVLAAFSQSLDNDFTFTLPAGRKECFFQTMKKDASLEIEYQVLDGAGLDVDFFLSSPSGQVLYSDYRKSDGVHTVETEDGDYMFCFDNTFSAVSEKLIFFELILDNMDANEEPDDWKEYVHGTDTLDMKLEDIMMSYLSYNSCDVRLKSQNPKQIHVLGYHRNYESNADEEERFSMLKRVAAKDTAWLFLLGEQQSHTKSVLRIGNIATSNLETINNVKSRLGKSVQIQNVLRAFEARDRNLQESNFDRVNFWSVINLVVMMVVSGVQVYLVRSLFDDKRKMRT